MVGLRERADLDFQGHQLQDIICRKGFSVNVGGSSPTTLPIIVTNMAGQQLTSGFEEASRI
jgi:hypothetical protein